MGSATHASRGSVRVVPPPPRKRKTTFSYTSRKFESGNLFDGFHYYTSLAYAHEAKNHHLLISVANKKTSIGDIHILRAALLFVPLKL